MQDTKTPTANGMTFRLHLSSPEQQQADKEKLSQKSAYNRDYWQSYKHSRPRIYGTMTPEENAVIERLAKDNGRSKWGQVIAESRAYRAGCVLAPDDVLSMQQQLHTDICRFGNLLNQLAKLGHIKAGQSGRLGANIDDATGQEVLRILTKMEERVAVFTPLEVLETMCQQENHSDANEAGHDY